MNWPWSEISRLRAEACTLRADLEDYRHKLRAAEDRIAQLTWPAKPGSLFLPDAKLHQTFAIQARIVLSRTFYGTRIDWGSVNPGAIQLSIHRLRLVEVTDHVRSVLDEVPEQHLSPTAALFLGDCRIDLDTLRDKEWYVPKVPAFMEKLDKVVLVDAGDAEITLHIDGVARRSAP